MQHVTIASSSLAPSMWMTYEDLKQNYDALQGYFLECKSD